MTLNDLLEDVLKDLPEDRRELVDSLYGKFGGSETFHFTLALLAATDSRERRLARMLLNDVDRLELD